MIFNYGEFAIIKIGIIYFLPNAYVFKRIAVTQPIGYEKISVFGAQHIRKTYIILAIYFHDVNLGVLNCDFCHS